MNCAKCGDGLRSVIDTPMRRRDDWTVQYWEALAIEFSGGFGMYMDPLASGQNQRDCTVVLCRTCAAAFLDENEWARPVVEGHRADEGNKPALVGELNVGTGLTDPNDGCA